MHVSGTGRLFTLSAHPDTISRIARRYALKSVQQKQHIQNYPAWLLLPG
jgi:hypothetical protein